MSKYVRYVFRLIDDTDALEDLNHVWLDGRQESVGFFEIRLFDDEGVTLCRRQHYGELVDVGLFTTDVPTITVVGHGGGTAGSEFLIPVDAPLTCLGGNAEGSGE